MQPPTVNKLTDWFIHFHYEELKSQVTTSAERDGKLRRHHWVDSLVFNVKHEHVKLGGNSVVVTKQKLERWEWVMISFKHIISIEEILKK